MALEDFTNCDMPRQCNETTPQHKAPPFSIVALKLVWGEARRRECILVILDRLSNEAPGQFQRNARRRKWNMVNSGAFISSASSANSSSNGGKNASPATTRLTCVK